jgi:hypothetical protein
MLNANHDLLLRSWWRTTLALWKCMASKIPRVQTESCLPKFMMQIKLCIILLSCCCLVHSNIDCNICHMVRTWSFSFQSFVTWGWPDYLPVVCHLCLLGQIRWCAPSVYSVLHDSLECMDEKAVINVDFWIWKWVGRVLFFVTLPIGYNDRISKLN